MPRLRNRENFTFRGAIAAGPACPLARDERAIPSVRTRALHLQIGTYRPRFLSNQRCPWFTSSRRLSVFGTRFCASTSSLSNRSLCHKTNVLIRTRTSVSRRVPFSRSMLSLNVGPNFRNSIQSTCVGNYHPRSFYLLSIICETWQSYVSSDS